MKNRQVALLILLVLLSLSAFAKDGSKSEKKKSTVPAEFVIDEKGFEEGYVERQVLRYEAIIKQYRDELHALIKRNVEEKKRVVENKYAPPIKSEIEIELSI